MCTFLSFNILLLTLCLGTEIFLTFSLTLGCSFFLMLTFLLKINLLRLGATDKPCGGGLSTLTQKPLLNDT